MPDIFQLYDQPLVSSVDNAAANWSDGIYKQVK